MCSGPHATPTPNPVRASHHVPPGFAHSSFRYGIPLLFRANYRDARATEANLKHGRRLFGAGLHQFEIHFASVGASHKSGRAIHRGTMPSLTISRTMASSAGIPVFAQYLTVDSGRPRRRASAAQLPILSTTIANGPLLITPLSHERKTASIIFSGEFSLAFLQMPYILNPSKQTAMETLRCPIRSIPSSPPFARTIAA